MEQTPAEVVQVSRTQGQPVLLKVLEKDISSWVDRLRLECQEGEVFDATDFNNGMCMLVTCSKADDPDWVYWTVLLDSPEREHVSKGYSRALSRLLTPPEWLQ